MVFAENDQRMSLMGFDTRARKTVLFAIGAAIAGLAGGLFANWAEIVTPGLFGLRQTAEIIIWCIVGGLGTRMGPILGAAGLALFEIPFGAAIHDRQHADHGPCSGVVCSVLAERHCARCRQPLDGQFWSPFQAVAPHQSTSKGAFPWLRLFWKPKI